jgi:hypothetical protein
MGVSATGEVPALLLKQVERGLRVLQLPLCLIKPLAQVVDVLVLRAALRLRS